MGEIDILNEALINGAFFVGRSWSRYLVVCGGAFLLFWVVLAKRLAHRRCQRTIPEPRIQRAELRNSLLGIIFFMIPSVAATPLYFSGHIKLILDPSATHPAMIALSFVLFVIGADAWFYWTHRAMHDSRIYRWTHELHHLSAQPSPLAGYAFSIIEGIVLGLYLPLVLLVFPLNRVMLWVFVFWFTFLEAYVHLGFEVLPRWVARNPIGKYLGTAVFHDMHHENGAYNFAVYFTWWDRLMGTIHPDYTERYEQVTEHPLFGAVEPGRRGRERDDVALMVIVEMGASPSPVRAPSLLARTRAVLVYCVRVLFRRWPKYGFDDLAGIQDNLDGPAFARAAAQMWADPEGRRLMQDRALLTVRGADWEYFSRLPIDSFGYNVWHHFYVNDLMEDIELQPSGLRWDEDTEYAKARYRSSHDMRHIVLGLGTEVHEEVSLQVFQYAQLPQKLSALVVVFGVIKLMVVGRTWRRVLANAPRAWRSAKCGRKLHCLYFEDLWELPLDELRERYQIRAVGARYPVTRRHPDAAEFRSPYPTRASSPP